MSNADFSGSFASFQSPADLLYGGGWTLPRVEVDPNDGRKRPATFFDVPQPSSDFDFTFMPPDSSNDFAELDAFLFPDSDDDSPGAKNPAPTEWSMSGWSSSATDMEHSSSPGVPAGRGIQDGSESFRSGSTAFTSPALSSVSAPMIPDNFRVPMASVHGPAFQYHLNHFARPPALPAARAARRTAKSGRGRRPQVSLSTKEKNRQRERNRRNSLKICIEECAAFLPPSTSTKPRLKKEILQHCAMLLDEGKELRHQVVLSSSRVREELARSRCVEDCVQLLARSGTN